MTDLGLSLSTKAFFFIAIIVQSFTRSKQSFILTKQGYTKAIFSLKYFQFPRRSSVVVVYQNFFFSKRTYVREIWKLSVLDEECRNCYLCNNYEGFLLICFYLFYEICKCPL